MPGDGRLIGGAADCGRNRNPAREAKRLRDYLKDYFKKREQWPGKMTEYNSRIYATAVTSPFQD